MRSLLAPGEGGGLWALSSATGMVGDWNLPLPHVCSLPAPTVPDSHPPSPLLAALGGGAWLHPLKPILQTGHGSESSWDSPEVSAEQGHHENLAPNCVAPQSGCCGVPPRRPTQDEAQMPLAAKMLPTDRSQRSPCPGCGLSRRDLPRDALLLLCGGAQRPGLS